MESVVTPMAYCGNEKDFLTTRVSYKLNLKGPSIDVQTACSSSLVAVHLACQGLWTYQCDMALSGGVSLQTPRMKGYLHVAGQIFSSDGYCRAFDENASGTVFGEGAGIVVLKRLEDAVRDGDTIYAVIKGIAVNNDGADKVSFTAPGVNSQAEVVATAQALAGVDAADIGYIETHGTGTPLGDAIEISALTQVFRNTARENGLCRIGSVKPNIGHLDVAAGVAGLIKTALCLKHRAIPRSLF
jgi:phthiocerol/phenolphthiocerol synthesis type-I polyketide synthase E